MSSIIKRTDWYAVTAFTVPFLVYLLTLAPSVTFFDSGEFLTAIFSLGSAHSPGYPLFVNYAKPFTWLPFGSIAFRVNMATAFSASAACLMTYLLCVRLLKSDERVTPALTRMAGVAAGVAFAFTPRLWLQSNHDKPYPLVSVIAAVIFYLLLAWRKSYEEGSEDNRYIYISSFLFGAAFGAHQTIVLMLPAYGWLILSRNWRLICRVKELTIAFGFAILGISIYLHMPVRAVKNPLLNWGDPKTLTQFLWSFLRKGYPTETPDRDFALLLDQLSAFNVIREFTPAGFLFVIVALVFFRKRLKDEITAYIIGIVSFLVVIAGMQNTPRDLIFLTEEFFTPLYLLTAVFIGVGLSAAIAMATRGLDPEKLKKRYVQIVILFILSLLPVTICSLNFRENDQHLNYIAYDYGMNTLRSLPKNAVLFTWGDSGAFPLWYLQGVERMREDVPLLHTPHLVFDWYLDSFPDLFRYSMIRRIPPENLGPENALFLSISEFISQRPVFIDFSTRYSIPFNGYGLEQHGITYRLVKNAGLLPPNGQVWDLYYSRGLFGDDMPFRDLDTGKAILIYANSHMEMGETLLRMGRTEQAMMEMRKAELISPEMKPQINQIISGFGL